MGKRTNFQAVPERLVTSPADGATQNIDWNLYGSAMLAPAGDGMGGGTLTLTFSNKTEGQKFDLWIDLMTWSMGGSLTFPTNRAPSGTPWVNTSGSGAMYHFVCQYIDGTLFIECAGSGH